MSVRGALSLFLLFLLSAPGCGGERREAERALEAEQSAAHDLRQSVTDERAILFYRARGWKPAWTEGRAATLLAAIGEADRHAISTRKLLGLARAGQSRAQREAGLTLAALTFADALANGSVDPRTIWKVYTLPVPAPDLAAGLEAAVARDAVGEWLASLPPADAEYRALSAAYLAEKARAARAGSPKAGMSPGKDETDPVERARILALNLERRRWLERVPPPTRIDVNSAAATLDYWRDGSHARHARVIVGRAGWETPQITTPIGSLVANPPWTIPEDIGRLEILPKGRAYMRRNAMRLVQGRIIQAPGPKSALGLVKFDMPNPYLVYLHDTPAKHLFEARSRHASHGCARVEGALEFARMIARHDGTLANFDKALASRKETPVALAREVPVRFLYHTAFLHDGRVMFRPDPYGWDEDLAGALGLAKRARQNLSAPAADAGP